ncbi:ABC transporter permease [Corynebacterium kroppenstedtii]|uniref:ABC transporter permease n=1 Tax=Corynebacterium sp. PCR 32 TaxID=3351342 RepID=UPI0030B1C5EB
MNTPIPTVTTGEPATTTMRTHRHPMWTISSRNLRAHKIRLALTVLAVVLGTAFVSGSFIFTATLNRSFTQIVTTMYDGVDIAVTPGHSSDFSHQRDTITRVPGVRAVNEMSDMNVAVAHDDGTMIDTGGANAHILPSYDAANQANTAWSLTSGHHPTHPGDVTLNSSAAKKNHISIGDHLIIATPATRTTVTVVGLYTTATDFGGWAGVGMIPNEFRTLAGHSISSYNVALNPGADTHQAIDAISHAVPGATVQTGADASTAMTSSISDQLTFINYFLLAFGAIGVIVGTFIIANTFSMIVAQRQREFALLRSLGASRGHITRSVLVEAAIIGVIGSVIGIAAGFGLVRLLLTGLGHAGLSMPDASIPVTWPSIVWPLIIGIVVTLLSAWTPAWRAGSTHPVETMNSTGRSAPLRGRTLTGLAILLIGAGLAWWGGYTTSLPIRPRMILIGGGAVAIIIGTLAVSAALSLPLVGGIGRILGIPWRAIGTLAATNASRNPRRTATTAFALTLGLALVSSVGMIGASMKSTVSDLVDNELTSELVATPPGATTGSTFSLPSGVNHDIASVPGVTGIAPFYTLANATLRGDDTNRGYLIFTPNNPHGHIDLKMRAGSEDLSRGGTIINTKYAKKHNLHIGSSIDIDTLDNPNVDPSTSVHGGAPAHAHTTSTVIGVMDSKLFPTALVSQRDVEKVSPSKYTWRSLMTAIRTDPSVNVATTQARIRDKIKRYVIVQVQTRDEFKGQQAQLINQLLSILYGLLALSVVIAILGIINTLALSVTERRREIGMLRAVGMVRAQVRRLITLESIHLSLYGALIGVGIGLYIGWMFMNAMRTQGITNIVIPWGQIIAMLGASAVVGIIAAAWPSIRASRISPLEAIDD